MKTVQITQYDEPRPDKRIRENETFGYGILQLRNILFFVKAHLVKNTILFYFHFLSEHSYVNLYSCYLCCYGDSRLVQIPHCIQRGQQGS